MTVYAMCSVRDVVASTFGQPFFSPNTASATRSLSGEVNSERGGLLSQHPDDFELWCLGSFDDQAGEVDMLAQPQLLVRCRDLVISSRAGSESVPGPGRIKAQP